MKLHLPGDADMDHTEETALEESGCPDAIQAQVAGPQDKHHTAALRSKLCPEAGIHSCRAGQMTWMWDMFLSASILPTQQL